MFGDEAEHSDVESRRQKANPICRCHNTFTPT